MEIVARSVKPEAAKEMGLHNRGWVKGTHGQLPPVSPDMHPDTGLVTQSGQSNYAYYILLWPCQVSPIIRPFLVL